MAAGDDSLVKETDLYFNETLLAHCNCNKSRRIRTLKMLARKTFERPHFNIFLNKCRLCFTVAIFLVTAL